MTDKREDQTAIAVWSFSHDDYFQSLTVTLRRK